MLLVPVLGKTVVQIENRRKLDGETVINAFKIAIRIVKTNQGIIGRQCIGKDDLMLVVKIEDKKAPFIKYHGELLIAEFEWDNNSLSKALCHIF